MTGGPPDTALAFDRLDREELARRGPDSLLIIPVGATEQHGPTLPTGTDTFHTDGVARRAATIASEEIPVLVAPPMPYGSSEHHVPFGATLSLQSTTLLAALLDIGTSAVRSGFRRVFYLNGHGGNHEIVQLAARDLSLQMSCHAAGGSWWEMARPDLLAAGADRFPRVPGHAGAFEAAILTGLDPRLTPTDPLPDTDRASLEKSATSYRAEFAGFWKKIGGYSDDPGLSESVDGSELIAVAAAAVAAHLIDFYRSASAVDEA